MNRPWLWIAVGAAAFVALACDPKTPKPTDPPKPIAQMGISSATADELLR